MIDDDRTGQIVSSSRLKLKSLRSRAESLRSALDRARASIEHLQQHAMGEIAGGAPGDIQADVLSQFSGLSQQYSLLMEALVDQLKHIVAYPSISIPTMDVQHVPLLLSSRLEVSSCQLEMSMFLLFVLIVSSLFAIVRSLIELRFARTMMVVRCGMLYPLRQPDMEAKQEALQSSHEKTTAGLTPMLQYGKSHEAIDDHDAVCSAIIAAVSEQNKDKGDIRGA